MKEKDIAVIIQNLIQFYSMKAGIDELLKRKHTVDIFIPVGDEKSGIENLYDETYNILSKLNYSIRRQRDNDTIYKVLLEPYPVYLDFNSIYRIKYKYSAMSAKPSPVYKPDSNLCYDGIICFGDYEANYLATYSRPLVIGNMKYQNFKRRENKGKPILLYLPTYGEHSYIENFIEEIDKLQTEYEVMVKIHHGTSFFKSEEDRVKKLKEKAIKCYDQNTELVQLLEKANVVLSDNSGSIFEAIYANVPVAIFAKDINDTKLENFDTTQYLLVKNGIVPYTDNNKDISKILKQAMSKEYYSKQTEWRNKAFNIKEDKIEDFIEIIEQYLNDDEKIVRYKHLHDVLKNDYYKNKEILEEKQEEIIQQEKYNEELNRKQEEYKQEIYELNNENNRLKLEIQTLKSNIQEQNIELDKYRNGKLFVIANKLYKMRGRKWEKI